MVVGCQCWPAIAASTRPRPAASQATWASVSRHVRRCCSCGSRSATATYTKLLLGSETQKVLTHGTVPVLVVR